MAKVQNTIGLSRDLIIHPGETLAEVIEDREMSQRELAIRTGMTEKHISTVIRGQKNISPAFARKLEYALGIEASFWMNLQFNYDRELLEFEEVNSITSEELSVLKNLKEVSDLWETYGWIEEEPNPAAMVLDYRMLLGISNLLDAPKITYSAAYRIQRNNKGVDPYVLFAWQMMCERVTKDIAVAEEVDIEKLRESIPEIKKTMFLRANQIQRRLAEIFAECGIVFKIVPHFTGAPVQGFIKKTDNGSLILCMTIRQKFADIFWFTLFHEISHILNGDMKTILIDFDSVSGEVEDRADKMASDFLINAKDYKLFVESEGYKKSKDIERFAETQSVRSHIVLGRLMKEGLIPWGDRLRYEWS